MVTTLMNLYIGEDVVIEYNGLRDSLTKEYINDAVMTYTVQDEDGNDVTGAVNIPMSYVATSNGIYRGLMDAAVTDTLTEDAVYYVLCVVSGSVKRKIPSRAKYRTTH